MNEETEIFELKPSDYVRTVMGRWLSRYWWIFAVAAVACGIAAAAVSAAFIFVGMMLMFLVVPSALMFVYFNYALKPCARRQIAPHRVALTDCGISLIVCPTEEKPARFDTHTVRWHQVSNVEVTKTMLTVATGRAADDFILVPADAFGEDAGAADRFIHTIYSNIPRKSLTLQS